MEEENKQSNTVRIVVWIVVLLFLLGTIFYFAGFRINMKPFGIKSPGSLHLLNIPEDTTIIIDNNTHKKSASGTEASLIRFIPSGTHTVSVFKEGFWPWQKEVNISSGKQDELKPLLINKNPVGKVVETTDPKYQEVQKMITDTSIQNSATSSDGLVSLHKEGNLLKARFEGDLSKAPRPFCSIDSCEAEIVAFVSETQLRSIGFYKDRNDVALVAVSNGIYAVELDEDAFKNFQPLYKGKSPLFAVDKEGRLYILDEGTLMELYWQ
jgi:hypothetical protein